MLRFLASRENGSVEPTALVQAESTKRAFSLALSRRFDVEKSHPAGINSLDLDQVENRYMLSGGTDGFIAIHDVHATTGVPKVTYPLISTVGRGNKERHKFSIGTVQWYPLDTGMFTSSGMDKLLKVWDTNYLSVADEYVFRGNVYSHHMSSVSVQHTLIAVASESAKVRLIDVKSGSSTHTLVGHRMSVLTVQWSPRNEFILASGSVDSRVHLWDIRHARSALMVLDQHNGDTTAGPHSVNTAHNGRVNAVHFTFDGLHLVTFGTDEAVHLWDTAKGQNQLTNYGKISNDSRKAVTLATSWNARPDLLYVPADGDIKVFDLFSGDQVGTLRGHYNQVNCVFYNADTHDLYSGANDRNILIWNADDNVLDVYEEELNSTKVKPEQSNYLKISRPGAPSGTLDAWSSDEDE